MASFPHLLDQRRLIGPGGSTVSGDIYFYYTGTSVLAPIYSDASLAIPMTNPVAVGAGEIIPMIFLDSSIVYRRVIIYSDGTQDQEDPIGNLFSEGEIGLPVGAILDYSGTAAPSGFLFCYGQEVSRSTYDELFTAIGTAYGVGNGTTTFNLPDFRGRVGAGKDNMGGVVAGRLTSDTVDGLVLGSTGGNEVHILTVDELPNHNHTITDPGHVHNIQFGLRNQGGTGNTSGGGVIQAALLTTDSSTTGITLSATGGDDPHNNVQPTIVVNKIIKVSATTFLSIIGIVDSDKANAAAIGITPAAVDMGTFTGSTISDNGSAKDALQELETAVETKATSATLAASTGAGLIGSTGGITVQAALDGKQAYLGYTPANLAGDAFTGTISVGDANHSLQLSTTHTYYNLDTGGDRLHYDRTANQFDIQIGGAAKLAVTTSLATWTVPVFATNKVRVTEAGPAYFEILNSSATTDNKYWRTAVANTGSWVLGTVNDAYTVETVRLTISSAGVATFAGQVNFTDSAFNAAISSGNSILTFDSTDYIHYNRTTNIFSTVIAGTTRLAVSATAATVTGNAAISGTLSVGGITLSGADGSSAIGVTLAGTGATLRTVEDILEEHISVKRFGVLGDGTDESVNLQKAFDYIAANGGTLYFPVPSSTYSFGTPLTCITSKPIGFIGQSPGAYTKTASSTGQVRLNYTGSSASTALKIEASSTVSPYFNMKNIIIVTADQAKASGGVGLALRGVGPGLVDDVSIAGFATGFLSDDNPTYAGGTAHPCTFTTFNRFNISRAAKQRADIRGSVAYTFNDSHFTEEALSGYDYDLTVTTGTNGFRSDSHTWNSCQFIGVGNKPSKNVRIIDSLFNTFNQCDFEQSTTCGLEVYNNALTALDGAVVHVTLNDCWFNGQDGFDVDSQRARTVINNIRSATSTGNPGPNIRFVGDPTGATQPDIGGGVYGGMVSYGGTSGIYLLNLTNVTLDNVNIIDALARSSQPAVDATSSAHKCKIDVRLGASTGAVADASTDNMVHGTGLYTTSYAPTVTATSGTITTKSATSRYTKIGPKTIHFQTAVTITTNGTGAGAVRITLPVNGAATAILSGRQTTGGTGQMLQGIVSGGVMDITTHDNLYPAGDGYVLTVSGVYEIA